MRGFSSPFVPRSGRVNLAVQALLKTLLTSLIYLNWNRYWL